MKKILLIGMIVIINCLFAKSDSSKPKKVFTSIVEMKEVFNSLIYPAVIVSKVNATVLADSQGMVTSIFKKLGEKVKVGDKLLLIKNSDPAFEYSSQNIIAPVAGVVNEIMVTIGSVVNKGHGLITVIDPDQRVVNIEITSSDLNSMAKISKGLFISRENNSIGVKIDGISPSISPLTGTAKAELIFTNQSDTIKIGDLGKVVFKSNIHKGVLIPVSAISYQGKDPIVKIINKGHKIIYNNVKLGDKRAGKVEILEGLNEGAEVVIRSTSYLSKNDLVEVVKTKTQTKSNNEKKSK